MFGRISNSVPCTGRLFQTIWNFSRSFSNEISHEIPSDLKRETKSGDQANLQTHLGLKFKKFRDEDSDVIFDVTEEQKKIDLTELSEPEEAPDPYEGLNLIRGINGVFEIEDLVELLKRDNAKKVFVVTVPKEFTYADYIVIATAKSPRHMLALANFVRKAYKIKRHKSDSLPRIEGVNSKEWLAMDMGNIALHIFTDEARKMYDLETLWTVGCQYDDLTNRIGEEQEIEEKYSDLLREFQPAE